MNKRQARTARDWRTRCAVVALLSLSGCTLKPWQRGALIGAGAGAAGGALVGSQIKGADRVVQIQPDPRQPPIEQVVEQGSRQTWLGAVVGGLVGAAIGALIGKLTEPAESAHVPEKRAELGEPAYLVDRVLAVIPLGSIDSMRALADNLARAHGLAVLEVDALSSSGDGLVAFQILDGGDVRAKVAALEADPRVRFAQPDFVFSVASLEETAPAHLAYGAKLIGADHLRGYASGSGITVALVDTGVDADDIRIKSRIVDTVDVTGNAFTRDLHGTLLAGIIAADELQSSGIGGIAPGVQLLAIKACQPQAPRAIEAHCGSLTLAKGIDLAVQKGARVINLSVAGPKDQLVPRLVDAAVSKGSFVVAAAGNDGPDAPPAFPAALDNVVAVTAVDADERLYPLANRGAYVDLSAPGVEILSTAPDGKYLVSSGTSFAAAHVAGAAALLLERRPRLMPFELQRLLEETAKDLGPPSKDPLFGSGLVDVCRAAAKLEPAAIVCPEKPARSTQGR